MCSYPQCERLASRAQEAVDEGQVREFVADVAARIDAFVEELKSHACAPGDADWIRGRGRRSRTDWVA